jgi:hypothetical protein
LSIPSFTKFQPSFFRILILIVSPASPDCILLRVLCCVAASFLIVGAFDSVVWCSYSGLSSVIGVIMRILMRNLPT